MSDYATPLLYINMGGEMLYVLRQRLKAQRIDVDKTVKVLNDITAALLNPKLLAKVFEKSSIAKLSVLRPTLECVALCSIMKLDENSMNRLFDLMIMMVKYQLTAVTGPKEVILMTLNHIDAMRNMVSDENTQKCVELVHQLVVDHYSVLTLEEIWEARNACLSELETYCVRVSILLRLGLQNEDTTFNLIPQKYDERYEDCKDALTNFKLKDVMVDKQCNGTFDLFGDRGTILGKNIYSPTYGMSKKIQPRRPDQSFVLDRATKAELGMLAVQLGTEEVCERPFTLNLFLNEDDESTTIKQKNGNVVKQTVDNNVNIEKTKANEEYKNKLDSVYADFDEIDNVQHNVSLLELLDEIE